MAEKLVGGGVGNTEPLPPLATTINRLIVAHEPPLKKSLASLISVVIDVLVGAAHDHSLYKHKNEKRKLHAKQGGDN